MYVGMGMSFVGRGEGERKQGMVTEHEKNREWEWQNTEWQPTPYCLSP